MWHDGKPAAEQCEGCTLFTGHAPEPSYLHTRDVTYATFCQSAYAESARYRDLAEIAHHRGTDRVELHPDALEIGVGQVCHRTDGASRTGGAIQGSSRADLGHG